MRTPLARKKTRDTKERHQDCIGPSSCPLTRACFEKKLSTRELPRRWNRRDELMVECDVPGIHGCSERR